MSEDRIHDLVGGSRTSGEARVDASPHATTAEPGGERHPATTKAKVSGRPHLEGGDWEHDDTCAVRLTPGARCQCRLCFRCSHPQIWHGQSQQDRCHQRDEDGVRCPCDLREDDHRWTTLNQAGSAPTAAVATTSPISPTGDRVSSAAKPSTGPASASHLTGPNAPASGAPSVQGLELFEVYEPDGSLLFVTSDASLIERIEGDTVYKRPWATSAFADLWWPKHRKDAENCRASGPGAWFSSGINCDACPPIHASPPPSGTCKACGTTAYPLGDPCSNCGAA